MKKKIISLLASALLVCSAAMPLVACGNDDEGVTTNPDGTLSATRITIWCGGSEWSGKNFQRLKSFINDYNKVKPDGFMVKLENPKSDLESSFQSAITSGKQPDIMLWDRFFTVTNSLNGYLYPVEDLIERDEIDTTMFFEPVMNEMSYQGHTYGLPIDIDIWGTYVNLSLADKYDNTQTDESKKITGLLKSDWTWDDLLTAAKAYKGSKLSGVRAGYSSGDQYEHLFKYYVSTGHGDEYLLPVEGGKNGQHKTNFNNQWTRDVLTFFKKVEDAKVGGIQEDDSFTKQYLAMVNKPLYYNNELKDLKGSSKFDYKFLPQPRQDSETGVNGGMIGGYSMAYPAPQKKYQNKAWEARHEAAWTFTKWLCTEKDSMLKWSQQLGSLPALNEALDSEELVTDNQVLKDARDYVTAKDEDGKYFYIPRPQVPNYLILQTDVINGTVKSYLSGGNLQKCIDDLTTNGNLKLASGLK